MTPDFAPIFTLLPTKTPIAEILSAYVAYMPTHKTARGVRADTFYLREMFGPICPALYNAAERQRTRTACGHNDTPLPSAHDRAPWRTATNTARMSKHPRRSHVKGKPSAPRVSPCDPLPLSPSSARNDGAATPTNRLHSLALTAIIWRISTSATEGDHVMSTEPSQRTVQTIERTSAVEKIHDGNHWLQVTITLWPILLLIALCVFRRQVAELLSQLTAVSIGSFSLKLRSRILKTATREQYDQLTNLSAFDLKFFFVIASQSWRIKSTVWALDVHQSLQSHLKLERAGLLTISNKETAAKDGSVNALLTPLGEEFYQELTSLIAQSIR